jgi:biopolymer transport protein ExbB
MKKLFMFLAAIGTSVAANLAIAQDAVVAGTEEVPLHEVLKKNFIDGGPLFMTPIILCLILGLAFVIERIIYLNLADVDTKKLIDDVETALASGGVETAKDICRNTRGPVASIFYQGLDRADEGVDMVEKAVVSYGGVQMGKLESNLSWIALFIAIAPSLGFLGTVIGMVMAFNDIENAGQISPTVVAGGMKVALITTVAGLIVAIILQLFYNYIISKVDSIVNKMEDASITLVDLVIKNKSK